MSPERVAALVARWVRLYTLGVPAADRRRRVGEVTADVHDQIAHERARGATSERRIALAVASRMLRGMAADASWRRHHPALDRSLARILLATVALLSAPLVGMLLTDEVAWGAFDFLAAGTLTGGTGLAGRAALRSPGGRGRRAAVAITLTAAFLLVWANLAVGVIGEPGAPVNLVATVLFLTLSALVFRRCVGRAAPR